MSRIFVQLNKAADELFAYATERQDDAAWQAAQEVERDLHLVRGLTPEEAAVTLRQRLAQLGDSFTARLEAAALRRCV